MSVWKKAAKTHQKTHRERHQPEERKHLGILEKKQDYVRRAKDYNEKKDTLKLLRKRALNRNPDEFYHHMINAKVEDGKHFDKETEAEDSPDQIKLMQTQDLKYITLKRSEERKRIEKLQAQLHLTNVDHMVQNKHIYFDGVDKKQVKKKKLELLSEVHLPDVDVESLAASTRKRQALYNELGKRIERERELTLIQQKIEMNKHLQNKTLLKPRKVRKGNKYRAPVYEWKYERKK
ncbi:probable U3 small nucleolar RNA-associated protein 11 [Aethina tumida]|uniref:probable U3 small nucleolar RNA-associated protein 11 n=1 Tax=Aethina tumida TaxID=116153 RepID=UPI00096B38F4|nr:probable U3 small nucleolar RNA-associated protein 11 [Aethina tumida]